LPELAAGKRFAGAGGRRTPELAAGPRLSLARACPRTQQRPRPGSPVPRLPTILAKTREQAQEELERIRAERAREPQANLGLEDLLNGGVQNQGAPNAGA